MAKAEKGFIPVMLTPFLDNGQIDFPNLNRLTGYYLESGAAGLFANCLSSEMFELTEDERLAIIRHVVEVTNGAVPVVATGTFGGSIEKQADFVKKVYDTGVEAVILITSLLAGQEELADVLDERVYGLLAKTGGIPVGFYECPVPYKRLLSPQQLQAYVQTGRVVYHKDTSLDLGQIREKLRLTEGHKFGLYDAYMAHAVESLKAGSAGLSCIQGNYFPELIVWLCEHYDDNRQAEAVEAVQQFLIDNMDVMHEVYPIVSKYFLQKRGFPITTYTRRAVGNFTPEVRTNVDQLFERYNRLVDDLQVKEVY